MKLESDLEKSLECYRNLIQGLTQRKCMLDIRKVHRKLNASWKICSLAVNGQSFLVIDGYLLNSFINGIISYSVSKVKDYYQQIDVLIRNGTKGKEGKILKTYRLRIVQKTDPMKFCSNF